MLTITPLPMRLEPDWASVARMVRESGALYLPADIPAESGRISLHRQGVALRPVRDGARIVAYCASLKTI